MRNLQEATDFFYRHARWSYGAGETEEQGRTRCARELAGAEHWAQSVGLTYLWESDWTVGSHVSEYDCYDEEPGSCETCVAYLNGAVVTALGCIDDADDNDRRVIEAELASEAKDEMVMS